jgi:hypothetical protein
MIELKEQFQEKDAVSKEKLKSVFDFTNSQAAVVINDVNYWTFGELQENIPEDYYLGSPEVSMNYQINKIKRHYEHFEDDCYIGFLHPWFGTGVLASGFGTDIIFNYKSDPAVDLSKIETIEEVRKLELPDPEKDGIMPKVLDSIKYYKKNCDLPVGVTDCQGPLTTALQVVGYDKFCFWMYDYPKEIHHLMDKVTEALIRWVKYQKEIAETPLDKDSYPLGVRIPEGYGGAWLSDDDAVIIDAENYKKFVVPYNEKFLKAFGGGCIHYCGTATQHIENYCNTEGHTCVNNLHLDNIGEAVKMREALAKKGIPYMACDFIPNDRRLKTYYADLLEAMGNQTGLIVVPYVAPAIQLESEKYESAHRNQLQLAQEVYGLLQHELSA